MHGLGRNFKCIRGQVWGDREGCCSRALGGAAGSQLAAFFFCSLLVPWFFELFFFFYKVDSLRDGGDRGDGDWSALQPDLGRGRRALGASPARPCDSRPDGGEARRPFVRAVVGTGRVHTASERGQWTRQIATSQKSRPFVIQPLSPWLSCKLPTLISGGWRGKEPAEAGPRRVRAPLAGPRPLPEGAEDQPPAP